MHVLGLTFTIMVIWYDIILQKLYLTIKTKNVDNLLKPLRLAIFSIQFVDNDSFLQVKYLKHHQ